MLGVFMYIITAINLRYSMLFIDIYIVHVQNNYDNVQTCIMVNELLHYGYGERAIVLAAQGHVISPTQYCNRSSESG